MFGVLAVTNGRKPNFLKLETHGTRNNDGIHPIRYNTARNRKGERSHQFVAKMSGFEMLTPDGKFEVLSTAPMHASEVSNAQIPLDWTRVSRSACAEGEEEVEVVRLPKDVVDEELYSIFDAAEEELTLIGTSGHKVTKIGGIEHMSNLTSLILRSHLISVMEGLSTFANLTSLELYDNQIKSLEQLESLPHLTNLDISFNVIRDMAPVALCAKLTHLYIANNKITELAGLEGLANLRVLDAGANRLRSMAGLQGLVNLEDLWLGKNKITQIEGLENLKKIKRLDIQSNRLVKIEKLHGQQETLQELYLASNGIDDAGANGLCEFTFPELATVDLSKNKLTKLTPLCHLKALNELWMSENEVATFEDVVPLSAISLQTIYLEHNPLSKDFEYRMKLKKLLPTLIQIDANMIRGEGYVGSVGGGGASGGGMGGGWGAASMTDAQRQVVMQKLQQAAIDRAKTQAELKAEEARGKGGGGATGGAVFGPPAPFGPPPPP